MKQINIEKKPKSRLLLILLMALMVAFAAGLTSCGSDEEVTDDDIDYAMNEGSDDSIKADPKDIAEAQALNKDVDNFIGTWKASSSEAENLYGSLEFTINEDGTFEADVTEEHFTGTWTKVDQGISYTGELMKGSMYYGDFGKMVIENKEDGVRVVVNRVN